MPFYLITSDTKAFEDEAALAKYVADGNINLDKTLAIKGTAQRLVREYKLQPLDAKPRTKRDAGTDAKLLDAVMLAVRNAPSESRAEDSSVKVADVAKACSVTTADVSRAKAKLVEAGKLDAHAKKGTLRIKAPA